MGAWNGIFQILPNELRMGSFLKIFLGSAILNGDSRRKSSYLALPAGLNLSSFDFLKLLVRFH